MNVKLTQDESGWGFRDSKGRVVRVSVTSPRAFATKEAALNEAQAQGFTFDGKRLAVA